MTCVLDRAGPPHALSPTLPNDVSPSAEPIASSLKVEAQSQMLELRTSSRPRKKPERFFDYVIKQEPGDSRPGCSKRTNGKSAAAKQGNEKSAAGKKKKEGGKPREDRPPIRTTTVRSDNFSYGVDFSALGFMKKNRSTRVKVELTYVHVSRMDRMIEHSEPVYKSGLRVDHEYLKSPNYSELSNETGYPIGAIVDSKVKVILGDVKYKQAYDFNLEVRAGSLSMNLLVDANACGNETRYYNHACKPNLNAVKVYSSNQNVTHDISFMTNKGLSLGDELTFLYAKGVRCKCVPGCRNYIY